MEAAFFVDVARPERAMAKCEEGYLCDVCHGDVAEISDSSLYLRYVIGEIHAEVLHVQAERHICCDPVLAQFIEHPDFEPVIVEGKFDRRLLDPQFVQSRTDLVTRGWLRLRQIAHSGLAILDYPLNRTNTDSET